MKLAMNKTDAKTQRNHLSSGRRVCGTEPINLIYHHFFLFLAAISKSIKTRNLSVEDRVDVRRVSLS